MQSGTHLWEHLEKINFILLDLCKFDVKIYDEDATLILLVSLLSSFENFLKSFVVSKDSLTLEEVKATLDTRELRRKAIGDNGESSSGLFFESGKLKRKGFNKGNNTGLGAGNDNEGSSKIAGMTCYYCK